jgi:BASS family bile acid:Na+ symporter
LPLLCRSPFERSAPVTPIEGKSTVQGDVTTQVLMPIGLMFIMLSLGLGLSCRDFQQVFQQPRAFAVGALCHFVLLPAVALFLVYGFGLSGAMAVGLMIIAASPTGTTSNLMTAYARGDVALAVAFTAFAGAISVISVPIIVGAALRHFLASDQRIDLSTAQMVGQVALVIGLPVAAGMVLRWRFPAFVGRTEPLLSAIAAGIFLLIFVASIVKHWALFRAHLPTLGPIVVSMNSMMLALGFGLARLAKVETRQAITVAIESSVQNGTLAIVIASTLLKNETMVLPGAVYSVVMCINGLLFVAVARRWLMPTGAC